MEMIIALIYVLHQVISPNLDLFYLVSLLLIGIDILKQRKVTLTAAGYIYMIILYALLQMLLNDHIEIQRMMVNIAKIYLNIFLFLRVRELLLPQIRLKRILDYISMMYMGLLALGLVMKTSLLWRLDDNVNIYQTQRFSLLYFEPSEASFHVCIVIMMLMYFVLREKDYKKNLLSISFIVINFVIVMLSAGMGGMLSLGLAMTVMYYCYLRESITIQRALMFIIVIVASVATTLIIIFSNSNLYLRLNDIVSGNDGSVVYRFNTSFRVMEQMLLNSNFVGIGFGNLNTPVIQNAYANVGLVEVISNSFMYAVAEGGMTMMVLLLAFHFIVLWRTNKDERMLKWSLFIFIVSYQVAGGYFTNPMNWIIYGLIANKVFMRQDLLQFNFSHTPSLEPMKKSNISEIQS
ncbi:O-antigen ligase family protein [Paenibacillus guangzhouensis]|uniref:O-antigen ligase family protein n=1 Tax=Paenibacillus guangzhouensis TaxID=1473112 RepID=UPI00126737A9|nr:hypothetical protein [Paenibacillus guangzhouensis]